ncbi:MAG: hypothetical protein FKGGLIKP_00451 [Sodalis sp. Fse]|nr:MAG: hypothetical protein FKGGLIKP_00451 [Sodalis sp. Fse]
MHIIVLNGRPSIKICMKYNGMANLPLQHCPSTDKLQIRKNSTHTVFTGLIVTYLNLNEVIHILRTKDDIKQVLIQSFAAE